MSDDRTPGRAGRGALGDLADLAELLDGESQSSRRFLGGLVIGALVGAAIAGSTVLRRHRPGTPARTAAAPAAGSAADPAMEPPVFQEGVLEGDSAAAGDQSA